jgi:hypothetical protein
MTRGGPPRFAATKSEFPSPISNSPTLPESLAIRQRFHGQPDRIEPQLTAQEPQAIRDQYGPKPFSQSCLMARRLVEAGVPLVTVNSVPYREWDTHDNNFKTLKNTLLPVADRGVAALLEDLETRGLLDETLVVWMGQMGRTPMINKGAGRDHWSFCYSLIMAGGGIRPGLVHGSSDRTASYPAVNPVSPSDIAATIFHCLGIPPESHVVDQQGRPLIVSSGTLIQPILV